MIQRMVDEFFDYLDIYVAHFTDCIQQQNRGQVLDLTD
jgi:hypothetical protein